MTTPESTSASWQKIAECLRTELAEYGGLLGLFEAQQKFLFERDANEVLSLSATIEHRMQRLQECRQEREGVVAAFATAHAQPANATLRSLLPCVEAAARPLVEALIGEVNRLLHRVRRTSRQNHAYLSRTVVLHQELLQELRPNAFTRTYSPAGRVSIATPHSTSTLRVAG
jgi:flagellar biosynthesis/type III secretory pathway chaperone